jgi:hypothetical protein
VGSIVLDVPDTLGRLEFTMQLNADGVRADNVYHSAITMRPD